MPLLIVIKINKTQGEKTAKTKKGMHNTVAHCLLTIALDSNQALPGGSPLFIH